MRNPKITLSNYFHRSKAVLSLVFEKDYSLIDKVKTLPGATGSKSRKFWYIPLGQFNFSKVFTQNCAIKSGIKKRLYPHILRYSFATYNLEQGMKLKFIQEWLGHEYLNTTKIYTHVSQNSFTKFNNPIVVTFYRTKIKGLRLQTKFALVSGTLNNT